MYQWYEIIKQGSAGTKEYVYVKRWSEAPIDHKLFHERDGHENPSNQWPFRSRTIQASNVWLGKYKLTANQIVRLGYESTQKVDIEEDRGLAAINQSWESESFLNNMVSNRSMSVMSNNGFTPLLPKGEFLIASTEQDAQEEAHIG